MVDRPEDYGAIAATNALSDIYATGAEPVFALAIAGFPADMAAVITHRVHQGACQVLAEAGAQLAGGHTIRLSEPVFGLAVTGFAERNSIWRKTAASAGDALLISKPLGTGILLAAGTESSINTATNCMLVSNRKAAASIRSGPCPPGAVTDVTGFGLIGHASEIAQASHVELKINAAAVPLLSGVLAAARSGMRTSGDLGNRQTQAALSFADEVPEELIRALADPQTAGGLLVSAKPELACHLLSSGFSEIGSVCRGDAAVTIL